MNDTDRNLVEIKVLSRRFDSTEALCGVDLCVPPGCVYGLVGANGAGKTTLLKHVMGLYQAKEGSVRVFGLDPVRDPVAVLSRIGYLSEERDLPDWMRIDELMRYVSAYFPDWDQAYADELCATFGLDTKKTVKNLSRGMRAQVALIVAVAHRPDLLVLDEPSTGLDAIVRRDILGEIVRAVAEEGRSVLFSSHLLDEVELMSDVIAMIHEGKIIQQGDLDDIKAQHHFVKVQFTEEQEHAPAIPGALSLEGSGRSWTVLCNGAYSEMKKIITDLGGAILEERSASLEEIFVARAGRRSLSMEDK